MDVPTVEPQLEAHLKVAADGHEHQVGVGELATVKDYQLLPHHPGRASRSIPPGSPGSPHQLVPGQLVEAVRLKLLLHHLPSLLLSLQRLFVVFTVLIVISKKLFGLGELHLQGHRLVGPLPQVVHRAAHTLLLAFLWPESFLVEHVCQCVLVPPIVDGLGSLLESFMFLKI